MAFNLLLFATLLFLLAISHIDGLQEPGAAVSAQGLDLNVHSNIDEGVHLHLTADTLDPTALPTVFPTALPTVISTARPTAKKTGKPSRQPTKSIYMDNPSIMMSTTAKQAIVGTLTILLFVLMALEFLAPEVLFMIALIITMLCQILTIQETLSGFSNESMITIGTLFLVIGAVEKSHIVDFMAKKAFGMTGSVLFGQMRMYITCFALSIFFNNTPLVAILMPVVKDWGRARNVAASQLLMPLSYSVLCGSFVSMIGTSTNLTVQGLMQADRNYSFSFFAPAPIGIPLFVIVLIYQLFAAPYLLPHHSSGLLRAVRDKTDSLVAEVLVSAESRFVGRSVGEMMNAFGVAPSRVIKIRRRATGVTEIKGADQNSMGSLFDVDYLKRALPFWAPSSASSAAGSPPLYAPQATSEGQGDIEAVQGNRNRTQSGNIIEYSDIIAPGHTELLGADDVVFVSSAQDVMEKLMKSIGGESKGLFILQSNVLALPGYGSELIECVVSDTNPFLNKRVSDISVLFSEKYKAAIITARGKDWGTSSDETRDEDTADNDVEKFDETQKQAAGTSIARSTGEQTNVDGEGDIELATMGDVREEVEDLNAAVDGGASASLVKGHQDLPSVSDHVISLGDVILCVTHSNEVDNLKTNKDFFVVSTVGELPTPINLYRAFPVLVFMVMLILVASDQIDMCPAALTVTCVFFLGGWITFDDIPKLVDIRLLMLMGCSLSFARAMTKTGLALRIAEGIAAGNQTHFQSLLLVYFVTLIITELISNNAAAALMYPIAVALADNLGVSFKTFAMAVLVASTAGFMSPIGYQTHVMVWGPGGYKFRDFLIFGIVPDVSFWIVGCALIVAVYPFEG